MCLFFFQESLNQSLAKAIFVSGAPLSMVDHPLWVEFLKKLRPSFKPPSRYRLTSTYLKAQYAEMQNEVTSQINEAKHLHLQCDGWSNIRNESIVNFIVSKPEPLFVEFIQTKEHRHNAAYIAELIIKVIKKYGPEKFLVIIGDNASNMRAALALVKEKHPSIIPLGCLAHLLHLLCEDILTCNTAKSFMATVIGIVKTIKNKHTLKALFDRFQLDKKFKDRVSLKLPGQTRWGSTLFCLQSLMSNKSVLQKLAVSEEAEISPDMKRQLLDDGVFWIRVEKLAKILVPIVDLITAIETNTPLIHLVYSKFNNLKKTLTQEIPESPLQKTEEKHVLSKLERRIQFSIGPIHLAADLLNPSSQGNNLKPEELLDAISFICEVGNSMGVKRIDLRQDIADYRDKEGLWRRSFIWEGVKESDDEKGISPMLWWRELRGTCVLADVALRILGGPVTSAATERTFSTFSFIHSKRRNRLTTERAGQITYLSHNWNLLNRVKRPKKQKNHTCENEEKGEEYEMQMSSSDSDGNDEDEDGFAATSDKELSDPLDLSDEDQPD